MNILLTAHQFFPHFTSGTEVLTLSVARELQLRGHNVRVYTGHPSDKGLPDNERFDEYEFQGIHVYRFLHAYTPMGGQVSLIEIDYDNHLAASRFEEILQDFAPDVVHFFHLNRLGTGLITKAHRAGISAYMTMTDFWAVCPTCQLLLPNGTICLGPNPFAGNCVKHFAQSSQKGIPKAIIEWLPVSFINVLAKLTVSGFLPKYPHHAEVAAIGTRLGINVLRLNQLQKIVAPNSMIREVLISNGVNPDLIVQYAYGIDAVQSDSEPMPRIVHQPLRIGYIGTLAKHKGCHVLVEAFKALPINCAVMKIYGNPEDFPDYSNELKLLAHDHGGIEFCGTFPNTQISEIFAGIDVLVVPSIWPENTPLVIYSSQAERCPIVASDLRGISEVITSEENGLLFEPGNATALTRQLLRLIDNPELVSRLGSSAMPPKSTSTYVDELLNIWK